MIEQKENEEFFWNLVTSINRKGMTDLMIWLKKTSFFTDPASTHFHLSCVGGLLQHSINVYRCLSEKKRSGGRYWQEALKDVSDESIILVSLFHDLCKVGVYNSSTRNVKTYDRDKVAAASPSVRKKDSAGEFIWETVPVYEFSDPFPCGHGEKSLYLLSHFIKLSNEEALAIRWHMGFADAKDNLANVSASIGKYPLVLALIESDLEACNLLEKDD